MASLSQTRVHMMARLLQQVEAPLPGPRDHRRRTFSPNAPNAPNTPSRQAAVPSLPLPLALTLTPAFSPPLAFAPLASPFLFLSLRLHASSTWPFVFDIIERPRDGQNGRRTRADHIATTHTECAHQCLHVAPVCACIGCWYGADFVTDCRFCLALNEESSERERGREGLAKQSTAEAPPTQRTRHRRVTHMQDRGRRGEEGGGGGRGAAAGNDSRCFRSLCCSCCCCASDLPIGDTAACPSPVSCCACSRVRACERAVRGGDCTLCAALSSSLGRCSSVLAALFSLSLSLCPFLLLQPAHPRGVPRRWRVC